MVWQTEKVPNRFVRPWNSGEGDTVRLGEEEGRDVHIGLFATTLDALDSVRVVM